MRRISQTAVPTISSFPLASFWTFRFRWLWWHRWLSGRVVWWFIGYGRTGSIRLFCVTYWASTRSRQFETHFSRVVFWFTPCRGPSLPKWSFTVIRLSPITPAAPQLGWPTRYFPQWLISTNALGSCSAYYGRPFSFITTWWYNINLPELTRSLWTRIRTLPPDPHCDCYSPVSWGCWMPACWWISRICFRVICIGVAGLGGCSSETKSSSIIALYAYSSMLLSLLKILYKTLSSKTA